MSEPKRILTIDGGGLGGVFSAAIIEQMEKVTGKPARYFRLLLMEPASVRSWRPA